MPRFYVHKDEKGRFPARHNTMLDERLVGVRAFNHPAVRKWHTWLLTTYKPMFNVALVTPCSNVKPYILSPTSRKIAGMLRKLGLWNSIAPWGVEWLYLSDLLVLVPYWRVLDYPACCYELHPDELLRSRWLLDKVAVLLASAMERLSRYLSDIVVFLPRKHLVIWELAKEYATDWPREQRVKYTLFSTSELREKMMEIVKRASA